MRPEDNAARLAAKRCRGRDEAVSRGAPDEDFPSRVDERELCPVRAERDRGDACSARTEWSAEGSPRRRVPQLDPPVLRERRDGSPVGAVGELEDGSTAGVQVVRDAVGGLERFDHGAARPVIRLLTVCLEREQHGPIRRYGHLRSSAAESSRRLDSQRPREGYARLMPGLTLSVQREDRRYDCADRQCRQRQGSAARDPDRFRRSRTSSLSS